MGTVVSITATFQRGSPSLYLLGAPVCISFGSMYNVQHVVGPWVSCSTYIPVSELGWSGDNSIWRLEHLHRPQYAVRHAFNAILDTYTYEPTPDRVDLTCTFSVSGWVRHLTYYRDVVSCPIVRLRDSNTAGDFDLHPAHDGDRCGHQAGRQYDHAYHAHRHAVQHSKWRLLQIHGPVGCVVGPVLLRPCCPGFIGVWTNTWANGTEAAQYRAATGHPFEEKQYILRIKTAGPCDVVVVPYLTGQRPANLNVVQVSGGLRVDPAARTLAN